MDSHSERLSPEARQFLKQDLISSDAAFIQKVPKVELHVHIEGTLTPELRWKLAQRHGIQPRFGTGSLKIESLEMLRMAYDNVISSAQLPSSGPTDHLVTFFQAYYSGFDFLRTKEDFFDLAMDYFRRAAAMNVRYCEPFFDPQGHTGRGIALSDIMEGFRDAQEEAMKLGVQSSWIMCFLRDQSPEAAMDQYKAAKMYKDMIVGIGLDSNEHNRPPSLFDEVFTLSRQDGFRLTAHCDVGVKDTHQHIHQVVDTVAKTGLDRIDHGLNAADDEALVSRIRNRGLALTICPWAYLRRETYTSIAERLRTLVAAGIKVCIASDSPVYMDHAWITYNLLLTKKMGGFTDAEMCQLVKNSVEMSWAEPNVKESIMREIEAMIKEDHNM
ncbi:adenosine deaminase [Acrodontium crateriforme]|uniref:Adenosine deaminase n=1 Tax=Acrodontium crateriforme TaxID=150365 RepID=A0AAQ3R1S4_9PEZI|nr:adenosine deaminase [Acrodontium crateriforme]